MAVSQFCCGVTSIGRILARDGLLDVAIVMVSMLIARSDKSYRVPVFPEVSEFRAPCDHANSLDSAHNAQTTSFTYKLIVSARNLSFMIRTGQLILGQLLNDLPWPYNIGDQRIQALCEKISYGHLSDEKKYDL